MLGLVPLTRATNSIHVDAARPTTHLGRESDFDLQLPSGLDDQTTFLLSEPLAEDDDDAPITGRSSDEVEADAPPDWPAEAPADEDDGDTADEAGATRDSTAPLAETARRPPGPRGGRKRVSAHGIEYPPLPPSFVKRVAQTALQSSGLSNARLSPDTLAALTQASEWFFEQLGDDLGAYARHAKRKTVEESDVVTLMRRSVSHSLCQTPPLTLIHTHSLFLRTHSLLHLCAPPPLISNVHRTGNARSALMLHSSRLPTDTCRASCSSISACRRPTRQRGAAAGAPAGARMAPATSMVRRRLNKGGLRTAFCPLFPPGAGDKHDATAVGSRAIAHRPLPSFPPSTSFCWLARGGPRCLPASSSPCTA